MRKAYECTVDEAGPAADQAKDLRVLGRVISFHPSGLRYEPDQRHAEGLVRGLGLSQANSVKTPWSKTDSSHGGAVATRTAREQAGTGANSPDPGDGDSESLEAEEATQYKSLSAPGAIIWPWTELTSSTRSRSS